MHRADAGMVYQDAPPLWRAAAGLSGFEAYAVASTFLKLLLSADSSDDEASHLVNGAARFWSPL